MKRLELNNELICNMYSGENKTIVEIAEIFDVSGGTIVARLGAGGVRMREAKWRSGVKGTKYIDIDAKLLSYS